MEVSITDISEVEKQIQIHASAAELAPHFEEAYRRYQKKIELKGFRRGKVPLDILKKLHGESIEQESLDSIAEDVYREVVKERDIRPIGEPVLTDIDYKRGEALSFTIKYEVKPEIELKDYKGIPLEKIIHRVTDAELEQEILRLRKANTRLEEALMAVDPEHVVTADIQQLDETGSPLIGKKTTNATFYLADEELFPEIKDGLKDAAVGQTKRVKIQREQNGKKTSEQIELLVRRVQKANLPVFDDEFIKKITKEKHSTVGEFRQSLRKDLEAYWAERSDRKLVDSMIGEIVRRHQVKVPETIVKAVLDSFIEDVKSRYPGKKFPPEISEDTLRQNSRGYAVFQATWYLIRERIIKAEGLKVDTEDMRMLAESEALRLGIDKDRLLTYYESSPPVKERIVSDKLIEFLKRQQLIAERVTEEFFE